MGQYYVIVNLDKKQFLNPYLFDEGAKLMEFGHSTGTILTALTALLANGNGRGGGDIFCEKYGKEVKKYSDKKRKTFPNAEKLNSKLIGSWAGDRIVIAGDYGDPYVFLTDEEIKAFQEKYINDPDNKDCLQYLEKNTNLYNLCKLYDGFYTDISKDIIKVLKDCGEYKLNKLKFD